MECKGVRAVIMCVLILGLVVAQIEAKSCCTNTLGRNCYNACRLTGTSQAACASLCDCIHVTGNTCPPTHPRSSMLENSDDVIEEVTSDQAAFRRDPILICESPAARKCFDMCRMTPQACAKKCDCSYVFPPLDLN